jgi:hypothetical protein
MEFRIADVKADIDGHGYLNGRIELKAMWPQGFTAAAFAG